MILTYSVELIQKTTPMCLYTGDKCCYTDHLPKDTFLINLTPIQYNSWVTRHTQGVSNLQCPYRNPVILTVKYGMPIAALCLRRFKILTNIHNLVCVMPISLHFRDQQLTLNCYVLYNTT